MNSSARTMSDVRKDDRIDIRLPADLKARVQEAADEDERTISQWVLVAIKEKLTRQTKAKRPKD